MKNLKFTIISAPKITFLIFLMVCIHFDIMGKIAFAYDAAGNRIKREFVIDQLNKAPGNTSGVNENFYDSIGEKSVTLTTNPTGIIILNIPDFTEEDKGYVAVYSLEGINILEKEIEECVISLDLSESPKGIYILYVRINENQTSWKIIKK